MINPIPIVVPVDVDDVIELRLNGRRRHDHILAQPSDWGFPVGMWPWKFRGHLLLGCLPLVVGLIDGDQVSDLGCFVGDLDVRQRLCGRADIELPSDDASLATESTMRRCSPIGGRAIERAAIDDRLIRSLVA